MIDLTNPTFTIGTLPVYGDLILAPMDGISDQPFRLLTRRMGSALTYTEFLNAIDLVYTHPNLEQHLQFSEFERPLLYQLFDEDPERLLKAALKLRRRNPDGIDINMGCSARSVSGRGAGAGLLRDLKKIELIITSLTKALDIPVTAKIRLGWKQDNLVHVEVAKVVEASGGKMIAVHGRTRDQSYQQAANWDAIAEVKQAVTIPVIANGDVSSQKDIRAIKDQTGCDAVMIGRAAVSNPWLFAGFDREQVPVNQVKQTIQDHYQLMSAFYGHKRGLVLFRKFVKRYLQPYHLDPELVRELMTEPDPARFLSQIDKLFEDIRSTSPKDPGR